MKRYWKWIFLLLWLILEIILYIHILFLPSPFPSGVLHFTSIVLAALFVFLHKNTNKTILWLKLGFLFTLIADYFLTLQRTNQFEGTVFFLFAQITYAMILMDVHPTTRKQSLLIRIILFVVLFGTAALLIARSFDALLIAALLYYGMLVSNAIIATIHFKHHPFLAIGLLLYIGCDTLVGLSQSAPYITLSETSIWYFLLHFPIDLVWFFYLPSQVFLALSVRQMKSVSTK